MSISVQVGRNKSVASVEAGRHFPYRLDSKEALRASPSRRGDCHHGGVLRFLPRYSAALACASVLLAGAPSSPAQTASEPDRAAAIAEAPEGLTAETRQRLREQAERASYEVVPVRAGDASAPSFAATNRRHQMRARFEKEGARIVPTGEDSGSWELGWTLRAYGYEGSTRTPMAGQPSASDNRVEYRRGPLVEWYVNDERGLEQGFDLAEPPEGEKNGELVIELELTGSLTPRIGEAGSIHFVDPEGRTVLRYDGLVAWDATGRHLPSEMAVHAGRLTLRIDDRNAVYPITIDPTFAVMEVKLVDSNGIDQDRFGQSVSIGGDTAVVGSYGDDDDTGSVFVFERNAGGQDSWGEVKKLTASDMATDDEFGSSVAASGDTVVVGAPNDDDNGTNSGSAYVSRRDAGGVDNWGQVAKLISTDGAEFDFFGESVAISVDTAVVGAPKDDGSGTYSGSAYVFQRDAGGVDNWGQVAKLTAPDGGEFDELGLSVAIYGDTVVVGAHRNDDNGSNSGTVYVYQRNAGGPDNWGLVKKLTALDAGSGDDFGYSVAISADTAVVGAPDADGDESNSGSAYVFRRDAGGPSNWGQVAELNALGGQQGDSFGYAVAIFGYTAVVGAVLNDDMGSSSGSAYVFRREPGVPDSWAQVAQLTASDEEAEDRFGSSVAIHVDTALVGARGESSFTGAAYVYFPLETGGAPGTPFCFGDGSGTPCPCGNESSSAERGCGNSTGEGCRLGAWGSNSLGQQDIDPLALVVSGAPPNQPGLFFGSTAAVNGGLGTPFGDGLRCANGSITRLEVVFASSNGSCSTSVPIDAALGVAAGDIRLFQLWYRDLSSGSPCGNGFNISNGYEVLFLP